MAAHLFEGECFGRVSNPEIGPDGKGKPRVRWDMIVTDGEHKGKRASYSGKLDPDNIKFTKRDMMAIGWKGTDIRTFISDVKSAGKVVAFTAEIASNTYEDSGKTSTWTSVKFGSNAKPLGEFERDDYDKVNKWFAEAPDVGAVDSTAPRNGSSGANDGDADIPFASCETSDEPSPIARILR